MALESEIRQLLEGVVAGDPFQAFSLSILLPLAQMRRECRRKQMTFHQDKGNPISISQLANECACVICGRQAELTSCIKDTAKTLLSDMRRKQECDNFLKHLLEWRERDRQIHYDKVTSSENKRKAELLVGTFERVSRSDATAHADIRKIFQRAFGLSNNEAGWLMKEMGIQAVCNYKKIRVAIKDSHGLKVPAKSASCCECPLCGFCWNS